MKRRGRRPPETPAVPPLTREEVELRSLRDALDRLPVGMVVWDQAGREVVRNRRGSAFSGDLAVDALVDRALAETVTGARAHGRDERVVELHGPPALAVRVAASVLGEGGVVAVSEDVSERRRLDAVRRDFIANVSHELRTPIGAIGVLAEAMAEEKDTAVLQRLASRVSVEAERAARLVADLLDLSRIEADAGRAQRQDVVIREVVDVAVARVEALAERSGVSLTVRPPGAEAVVHGDRTQLVSAVVNLLDNAVAYSDAGGTVEVVVDIGDGHASIAVRDEGIGIPTKDLERIFERFYRVDRARDRRTGGTGLGLAIVRHVVSNHGGEVTVESVEGEGSTFTLRLPVVGHG